MTLQIIEHLNLLMIAIAYYLSITKCPFRCSNFSCANQLILQSMLRDLTWNRIFHIQSTQIHERERNVILKSIFMTQKNQKNDIRPNENLITLTKIVKFNDIFKKIFQLTTGLDVCPLW